MQQSLDEIQQQETLQMPQPNRNMNSEEVMPPTEGSNPMAISIKKSNLAQEQDKGFKIAIMSMFKGLKRV